MKNGFTLVELSIVLVIIGLLVGGILVGQSLVDSAKSSRFISQLSQYDIMQKLFEDKFRDLPGDNRLFPVVTDGSDHTFGDGYIDDDQPLTPNAPSYDVGNFSFKAEIAYYWRHLFQAGISDEDYDPDASAGIRAGVNIPELVYEDAGVLAYAGRNSGRSKLENVFLISNFEESPDEDYIFYGLVRGAIPVSSALSIDQKLDDGVANIGDVTTGSCPDSVDNALYVVAEEDKLCNLYVGFGFNN